MIAGRWPGNQSRSIPGAEDSLHAVVQLQHVAADAEGVSRRDFEAEVDLMEVNRLWEDKILNEAACTYDRWPSLPLRRIAESPARRFGEKEIDITLSYPPSSKKVC